MALAVQRDLEEAAAGVARWLRATREVDDLTITRCDRPSDGLSSEILLVDVEATRHGAAYAESLVVRLGPSGPGAFPEYDLALQARAQEIAAHNGVPTAAPVEVETDTRWLGAPFLVMPLVAGHVPGPVPRHDGWIAESSLDAQATLYRNFLDLLATIHTIDGSVGKPGDVVPARDLDAELAHWARYLDWCGEGESLVPTLADALAWCRANRPPEEPPPTLLWGDARLGNVVFDEERHPVAVLDWEMATIGPAEHDVAWFFMLEATQNELLGGPVPGFLGRDAAIAHYETRLGRQLRDLEWFEIFAMVRSTSIMSRITSLHERAGLPIFLPLHDNPLLEILERRIAAAG